ncbi:sulfotransferase [Sandarakinorhabdus sp.]|uniref:sulfotransferase family protein n=1 Tax=Sandarakinorhabdus sp. TaxID=1916663 RepID=UPI00286E312C|nr:sulfotransferase [Sandarakinorhabdus sp.]
MALQVIGAGYGRTGTMSTFTALNQLGFPCYHMVEVIRNPANKGHLEFWGRVADSPAGAAHDWEQVFANYTAMVDFPGSCVWHELLVAYPDAKVLMTLHPGGSSAWYDSAIETIYFTENRWFWKVLEVLTPFGRKMGPMCRKLIWQRTLQGAMVNRAAAMAQYDRQLAEVVAAVPPDRLLVFTANQGWAPLCTFLGVPVPDTPFPNVNDRAQFQMMFKSMKRAAIAMVFIGAAVAAAIGWWLAALTA